ncbi:MAG TPA: ParB/RepB/Spo0J family partition protein [Fimbriimonas sp.]|nr:ParB/RepB/Spo0J family partition protein [Fimbriimonas sp.]
MQENYQVLPVSDIQPSATNPRKSFDEKQLQELADSIKKVGQIQPIVIRPLNAKKGPKFEIVAGERRWRATGLAGIETIHAIVRDISDLDMLELQIVENVQRADMHPLDEADAFYKFVEAKTNLQLPDVAGEIALLIGKPREFVYQRLRLRDLTEEARDLFYRGFIGVGHALELCRLPADLQQKFVTSLCYKTTWNGQEQVRADGEPDVATASVADLRHSIRRDRTELSLIKMAWSPSDDSLGCGPCSTCPKRTGANADLFGEHLADDGDRCLDKSCYDQKFETHLRRRIREITESGKSVALVDLNANSWSYKPSDFEGTPIFCSDMVNKCEQETDTVAIATTGNYRTPLGFEFPVNLNHAEISRAYKKGEQPAETKEHVKYQKQLESWKLKTTNEFRSHLRQAVVAKMQTVDPQALVAAKIVSMFAGWQADRWEPIKEQLGIERALTVETFAETATVADMLKIEALINCWYSIQPTTMPSALKIESHSMKAMLATGLTEADFEEAKKQVLAAHPKPAKPDAKPAKAKKVKKEPEAVAS